jgi:Ser/Thr protein kinase RdoA (MazF antagonist)
MTAVTSTVSASEVAAAFALGAPTSDLVGVARGAMGLVFRLDTASGAFAVKKLFHGPRGNESENAAFQFAAMDAGVRLARPILSPTDDVATQLDDGSWWRVYEWVDGEHCEAAPAPLAVAASMAEQLGRLHALAYDAGSTIDGWFTDALGAERINAALDVASMRGWDIEHRRADLVEMDGIVAGSGVGAPIGCHTDTGRSNVLVRGDRCTLLDWDNAGPGIAAREFASTLLLWAGDADREPVADLVDAMVRAYRDVGAEFAPNDLSVFAVRCSVWLHYVVMCCEHLADESLREEDLAFERGALEALVREDQSVRRLERFLEAIPA